MSRLASAMGRVFDRAHVDRALDDDAAYQFGVHSFCCSTVTSSPLIITTGTPCHAAMSVFMPPSPTERPLIWTSRTLLRVREHPTGEPAFAW